MKRQIVLGFAGALIVGVYLTLGACNEHSFKGNEFEPGVKKLYSGHHSEESHEGGHSDSKGHDSDKGESHGDKEGDKHGKDHKPKKGH